MRAGSGFHFRLFSVFDASVPVVLRVGYAVPLLLDAVISVNGIDYEGLAIAVERAYLV